MDLLLLAQNEPTLTSVTGWGAFSLVVAVLYWLAFHHLPGKDKQQIEMIDKHRVSMELKDQHVMAAIRESHAEGERQRIAFTRNLEMVVEHCREENAALLEKMRQERK